jgi:hypothetical protein
VSPTELPPHRSKIRFLIVYDYGMGGIWGCVWARSAEEVAEQFLDASISDQLLPRRAGGRPAGDGIVVFRERPDWMTSEQEADIAAERTFDIDSIEPSSYFAKFLRPRD